MGKKRYRDDSDQDSTDTVLDTPNEPEIVKETIPTIVPRKRPPKNCLNAGKSLPISFKGWFSNKVQTDSRLKNRGYKHNEILTFMRGLGLTDEESSKSYDEGLRAYFGG